MFRRDPACWCWFCSMVAAATAIAVFSLLMAIGRAHGHDWYPSECCSGTDCEPMSAPMLPSDERGWILPDGDVIAFHTTRKSRDGRFHWCRYIYEGGVRSKVIRPADKPVCLFVPEGDG